MNLFGNQSKSFLSDLVKLGLNSPKAFAYERIAVDSTVQALNVPEGTKYIWAILESEGVGIVARVLETTSTVVAPQVGMPLTNMATFDSTDFANINGIRITEEYGTITFLNVTYYK